VRCVRKAPGSAWPREWHGAVAATGPSEPLRRGRAASNGWLLGGVSIGWHVGLRTTSIPSTRGSAQPPPIPLGTHRPSLSPSSLLPSLGCFTDLLHRVQNPGPREEPEMRFHPVVSSQGTTNERQPGRRWQPPLALRRVLPGHPSSSRHGPSAAQLAPVGTLSPAPSSANTRAQGTASLSSSCFPCFNRSPLVLCLGEETCGKAASAPGEQTRWS